MSRNTRVRLTLDVSDEMLKTIDFLAEQMCLNRQEVFHRAIHLLLAIIRAQKAGMKTGFYYRDEHGKILPKLIIFPLISNRNK